MFTLPPHFSVKIEVPTAICILLLSAIAGIILGGWTPWI